MPNASRLEVDTRELKTALRKIGAKVVEGQLKRVVLDGLEPIKDETERRAPGSLARSNRKQIWKSSPTRIEGEVANTAPHSHLVEFGTAPRTQKKTGRFTGRIGSHHAFMRPAFDARKDQANAIVIQGINRLIEEAV